MSSNDRAGFRAIFTRFPELGLVLGIVFVLSVLWLVDREGAFYSRHTATSMFHQVALQGCLALGAAVVIIAGGIDLSVGAIVALSSVIAAKVMVSTERDDVVTVTLCFTMVMFIGVAVGLLHAVLINQLSLPPFIATLATMAGLRSIAKLICENRKITVDNDAFRYLGNHLWTSMTVFLLMAVAIWLIMSRTVLGRHLHALGGNETASRLSGLSVNKLKTFAYCLSGALAALTGILISGKVGQGDHSAGTSYELFAITAAVVGGCSLRGGHGTISGAILGLFLIQIIIKGASILIRGIDASMVEGLVLGIVIVLAVAFNQMVRGRVRI